MGVFGKLFGKTNSKPTAAQNAKQRLMSVCIYQQNSTNKERNELIQKIKTAVISIVNEYYKVNMDADKISINNVDQDQDIIEMTVDLPDEIQKNNSDK